MSSETQQNQEQLLEAKLERDPSDWDTRQQLAHLLYDQGQYGQAAVVIWEADQIPSTDMDIAFAARILAKDQPRKAIRLLAAVLEQNKGKSVQNMGMANALLHHGMVLQAARFYGAALEADPELVNPDLEHFILWTDEEQTLWGDFKDRRPKLGELPWMARDPMEALKLTTRISLHSTPISVPKLKPVAAEDLKNRLYLQAAEKNAKITPPPAVTIPADRVQAKHRRYDSTMGADVDNTPSKPGLQSAHPDAELKIDQAAATPAAAHTPDPSRQFEVSSPAAKPESEEIPATRAVRSTPPPALPVAPSAAPADTATMAEAPKGAPLLKRMAARATIGPDGKLRRPGAPVAPDPVAGECIDMEAIEAKAAAEKTQKIKIGHLAKAAASAADEEERKTQQPIVLPPSKIAAQGREVLPSLDANASAGANTGEKKKMTPEEEAAALEDMKKTRAIARAQAREQRLNAASAGVPLPSTQGRQGEWYYIQDNQAAGPILAEELKEKLNDPTMKPPIKMIWSGGMERWMPVYECPQLWQELNQAGV